MPVMEGKAALFKKFAGVDAWPICLDTTDTDEIVRAVELIAPGFGGVNLEDISAPRCFEIERRLRESLDIPVFHDDQHGTAVVVLAALHNALRLVEKDTSDIRVVMMGAGAAGVAVVGCEDEECEGAHVAEEDADQDEALARAMREFGAAPPPTLGGRAPPGRRPHAPPRPPRWGGARRGARWAGAARHLLDAVAVVDVDVEVEHARVVLEQLEDAQHDVVDVAEAALSLIHI